MKKVGLLSLALVLVTAGWIVIAQPAGAPKYQSPFDLAFSPDGKMLAVSDHTGAAVAILDTETNKVSKTVALNGEPTGVAWKADGSAVFVAELGAGTVAEVDPKGGKVNRRLNVGPRPVGLALAAKKNLLVVCNTGTDTVSIVNLADGKEKARVAGFRAPFFACVTPDESLAIVGNRLPAGAATDPQMSSSLSLVDLDKGAKVADIRLPAGGACLHKVAVSSDAKWVYAVHTVGRTNLPTTQLERGWVNTNAMSVIDLAKKEVYATLLLDRPSEGAADPWGLVLSKDNKTAYISLSGVHQLAKIDLETLHKLLAGEVPNPPAAANDPYKRRITGIWLEIKADPKNRAQLVNDLAALYSADLITRVNMSPRNPWRPDDKIEYDVFGLRGLDLSSTGKLATAGYFSGNVLMVDPGNLKTTAQVALGAKVAETITRKGERIFHDATFCFQHWLSCATCHPDTRADAMNWDLLNDGIGNPKNTKSMVWADKTPPSMSLGVRATMEVAAAAGFKHILFRQVDQADLDATIAYLRDLKPLPSPYLENGKLSAKAEEGKKLFEDKEVACASCHPAPLFTTLKLYDVGTTGQLDRGAKEFDTPTLIELWKTGPFLHDGAAATLMDVLTTNNKGDKHGKTSHLSQQQKEALVAYLLSL